MNVVISNVFADDNKGGALLTRAAIELVRAYDEDARISLLLIAADAGRTSLRHTLAGDPSLEVLQPPLAGVVERTGGFVASLVAQVVLLLGPRSPRASLSLKRLREADLVVSKGGYVFVERTGIGGLLALWMTAFPLLYASRCGAATVVLGATVGPFESRSSRWLNGFILRRMTAVVPREGTSERHTRQLGVEPDRVIRAPDGALGLARPFVDSAALMERYGLAARRFAVFTTGYSIADEADDRALVVELVSCARSLVDDGLLDEVLVVLQAVKPDGSSKDRRVSERLVAELAPVKARLLDADHSPAELIALYGEAAFVAGRRLHSALFGLLARVPSVAIVHPNEPQKARALFGELGLDDLVVDVHQPGQLSSTARSLIADTDGVRARVDDALVEAQHRWSIAAGDLRKLLEREAVL